MVVVNRRPPRTEAELFRERIEVLERSTKLTKKDDPSGEWEDGELAQDVYATAFLLAKNATPGMYSFNPLRNPEIRLLWLIVLFIIGSQVFVMGVIALEFPPVVAGDSFLVECADYADKSYAKYLNLHILAPCTDFEVEFSLGDQVLRRLTYERYFYQNILSSEHTSITILQVICCIWVLFSVYRRVIDRVSSLIMYCDFNHYFLPLKGEVVSNTWALGLPLLQWVLNTLVVSVSCAVICGYDSAVDIVLNSLAFTFIAEVSEYFNDFLVNYYGAKAIRNTQQGGLMDTAVYGTAPIMYLYPEYDEANYDENSDGWYILKHHKRFGMLSDYCFRHDPSRYPRPLSELLISPLKALFWIVPLATVVGCRLVFTPALEVTSFPD